MYIVVHLAIWFTKSCFILVQTALSCTLNLSHPIRQKKTKEQKQKQKPSIFIAGTRWLSTLLFCFVRAPSITRYRKLPFQSNKQSTSSREQ